MMNLQAAAAPCSDPAHCPNPCHAPTDEGTWVDVTHHPTVAALPPGSYDYVLFVQKEVRFLACQPVFDVHAVCMAKRALNQDELLFQPCMVLEWYLNGI